MTLVLSPSDDALSSDVPVSSSPILPPTTIFTVLCGTRADGKPGNSYAASVILALSKMLPSSIQCHVFSPQEVEKHLKEKTLDLTRAVALFDDIRRDGSYSLRHTQRFPAKNGSFHFWIEQSRWAAAIHRSDADRIARQLVFFLAQNPLHALFLRTSSPKKPRKPRRDHWRSRRRTERYAFS